MSFPEMPQDEAEIEATGKTVLLSILLLALVLVGAALVVMVNTSSSGRYHLDNEAFDEPRNSQFENCGDNGIVPASAKASWREFGAATAFHVRVSEESNGKLLTT